MPARTEIEKLTSEFESCQKILCAIGDENRQHLILEMMRMGKCSGVRVLDSKYIIQPQFFTVQFPAIIDIKTLQCTIYKESGELYEIII